MAAAAHVGQWRPHRPRGPIGAHFKSPGPKYMLPGSTGYIEHDARKYKNPAFSFGSRHATFSSDCSPGPGYLVPSHITNTGVDGTPKYSLYGRHQDTRLFKNPGPGAYSPEKSGKSARYSAPSYSLSGRTRFSKSNSSPGPGRYGFPAIITSKPPSYSIVGRKTVGSFSEDLTRTPGPGTYRIVAPWVYKDRGPLYSMTGRNMLPSDATRKPGPGAHSPEKVVVNKKEAPKFSFGILHSEYMMNIRKAAPNFSFGIRHSEYIAPLIVDPGH